MEWLVTNLVAACLLPPLNLLLLAVFGLLLARRRKALGHGIAWASLIALTLLSMPLVSTRLLAALQPYPSLDTTRPTGAQAIVVLGGGKYKRAPEYGGADTVGELTLARLRYGAKLARELHLPLLVTGGNPTGGAPEGHVMRDVLVKEWNMPVRWVEDRSMNTWENARFSADLLQRDGIARVILVTHAWHLPRAVESFQLTGIEVVPAGTAFEQPEGMQLMDCIPQAKALQESAWAFHEAIGRLWYKLKS
jgi:uncharacterized SAM-binding protein YcdF (DUF218 family)